MSTAHIAPGRGPRGPNNLPDEPVVRVVRGHRYCSSHSDRPIFTVRLQPLPNVDAVRALSGRSRLCCGGTAFEQFQSPRRNVAPSWVLQRRAYGIYNRAHAALRGEAWGPLGDGIVTQWAEFNKRYFDGTLKPVPLVLTNAQPYGRRLAFCSYNANGSGGRTITLNMPAVMNHLAADAGTLLHEMIHQFLFERGEYPSHDGAPWRREIMRLTKLINGKEV